MIPLHCTIKHDPDGGTFGDCLRACVASILNCTDAADVPHFFHDGCDGVTGNQRMVDWLRQERGLTVFTCFSEDEALSDVLGLMADLSPDTHYLLYGRTASGEAHVVIGKGGKIVHDPAWIATGLVDSGEHGLWMIKVLAHP